MYVYVCVYVYMHAGMYMPKNLQCRSAISAFDVT